jgi:hypothetical protein
MAGQSEHGNGGEFNIRIWLQMAKSAARDQQTGRIASWFPAGWEDVKKPLRGGDNPERHSGE